MRRRCHAAQLAEHWCPPHVSLVDHGALVELSRVYDVSFVAGIDGSQIEQPFNLESPVQRNVASVINLSKRMKHRHIEPRVDVMQDNVVYVGDVDLCKILGAAEHERLVEKLDALGVTAAHVPIMIPLPALSDDSEHGVRLGQR